MPAPKKVTRLPPRSAVVAFAVADVFALAELMRRQRGGTAVVMGALSPRARNAQVGLFQSGEVDYLVATDAIGMGLNMDLDHVAFARLVKFDGRAPRRLRAAEIAQIAGRAGRHMSDGTFGTTAELDRHRCPRSSRRSRTTASIRCAALLAQCRLDFRSLGGLLKSLEERPRHARPRPRARGRRPSGARARWRSMPEIAAARDQSRARCGCCGRSARSPTSAR